MKEVRDIEDLLVWSFRDQQVEHFVATLRRGSVGPSGLLSSGTAQTLVLGTRIDNSSAGARFLGARCHDDALTIYETVMALPAEAWLEIVKQARCGGEPYWHPEGPGRWEVPLDRAGRPKRLWRDPARQRGDLGEHPPVLIGTHPVVVEEARAIYRLWHTAMWELVPLVNRELTAFRASPPARSPHPWEGLARTG